MADGAYSQEKFLGDTVQAEGERTHILQERSYFFSNDSTGFLCVCVCVCVVVVLSRSGQRSIHFITRSKKRERKICLPFQLLFKSERYSLLYFGSCPHDIMRERKGEVGVCESVRKWCWWWWW